MSTAQPRVAVVIPTRNAGARFAETLAALQQQQLGEPFELVVIDSGSRDGTVERARAAGARVLQIPPAQFGHGRTRNQAIATCRGAYIALLVQDAIPADEHWLSSLVAALDRDPQAAGAYSRQLPHQGAGVIARQVTEYWYRHQGGRVEQRITDLEAFQRLTVEEKQFWCTFNNVSSIIRRAVWERYPLREIAFAEDLAWGYDVLRAGYTLVYEPDSCVYHSHERSCGYELRRAYVESRTVGELFGAAAQPLSVRHLARLARLWRARQRWAAGLLDHTPAQLLETHRAAIESRAWHRRLFGRQVLVRIFGGLSPYPEPERLYMLELLNRRYAAQKRRQDPAPSSNTLTLPVAGASRLDERINALVWANKAQALNRADYDFIFTCLWDELGRDYVRRAVWEEVATGLEQGLPLLEAEIRRFANELVEAASAEGALTPALYRDIWLYASAILIGRRLGAANRYGAGGRWGKLVERWFSRGV